MAKLYFRYSAMNAGKSTALMQAAHNYEEKGMSVLVMKPAIDTKWNDKLVSRLGIERKVDVAFASDDNLEKIIMNHADIRCVFVDEAQFCMAEQIDQLFRVAVMHDIPVICYGLRTDFQMKWFPGSTRLLQIAHEMEELKTICACGKKAICSMRLIDGTPVFAWDQVSIDNHVATYQSVCGKCYLTYKA